MHRPGRPEAGFTLVEVLVALAVFVIAIGGIYAVIVTQAQSSRITNNFIQVQENARYAMERIVEEARWGDAVLAATGGVLPSVTFDIPSSNPLMPGTAYTVTYGLSSKGTIQRTVTPQGGAPATADLASYVTGLTLAFYDNATPTPTSLDIVSNPGLAPQVYRVTIGVTVTVGSQSRIFTSDVYLRNKP